MYLLKQTNCIWVKVMVFNAIFNDISAISWRSILLVEETRICEENHRSATSHYCQTLSHSVVSSKPQYERDLNSHFTLYSTKI